MPERYSTWPVRTYNLAQALERCALVSSPIVAAETGFRVVVANRDLRILASYMLASTRNQS